MFVSRSGPGRSVIHRGKEAFRSGSVILPGPQAFCGSGAARAGLPGAQYPVPRCGTMTANDNNAKGPSGISGRAF
ncbi:hypothetical protein HMPREF9413_0931 [Paenibacillus sp. HGF7]|nr:hypothetical protein HMPREF9413_0931 [Paenibacillus sp. HGF7]